MLEVHLFQPEHFTAYRTSEFGAITHVYFHVAVQMVFAYKTLITNITFVLLIAKMNQHVFLQVVPHCKCFGTFWAGKDLGIFMGTGVVTTQFFGVWVVDVAGFAAPPAGWTLNWFLRWVHFLIVLFQSGRFIKYDVTFDTLPFLGLSTTLHFMRWQIISIFKRSIAKGTFVTFKREKQEMFLKKIKSIFIAKLLT